MKTGIKTKTLSLLLCVCVLLTTLAACGDKKDGPDPSPPPSEEPDAYYTSLSVQYSPRRQYSGSLTFPDEIDDSFAELNKDNFTLTAYNYVGEEQISAQLNDFSVTKTDDKNLAFTFKSPFNYDESISYVLMSETTVTAKEKRIAAVVYTHLPQPDLNIEYKGLYKGTDEATITATLTEDWKFAEKMTVDMLSFPIGFDVSVEVTRESDTKAVFVITNIPENYTGVAICATLSASAINSEFSNDTELCLDYLQPDVEVDPSSVNFDAITKVFTVGKVTLPKDFTGVQDGISVSSKLYSVLEQAYDTESNAYSFKLKIDEEKTEGIDVNRLLSYITVNAILKTETEEIKYAFNPYNAIAGVQANVITDTEDSKVYIEITPYNASFREGISGDDVIVSGADNLTGFVCSSVTVEKIVYTVDYSSKLTEGVALSFDMPGSVLNTSFGLNAYSLMAIVPPYSDGKDIDWAKLGKKIGVSAAGSLGSAIGSSVAGFVLPYVYEFLGVDNSDPDMKAIENSIRSLTSAIGVLTNDIGSLKSLIEAATNKGTLNDFQTLETSLLSASLSLLTNPNVVNYVAELDPDNSVAGFKGFKKFCEYLVFSYGSVENAVNEWAYWGNAISALELYNICCSNANSTSDKSDFWFAMRSEDLWGVGLSAGREPRRYEMTINTDYVYDLLQGEKKYIEWSEDRPKQMNPDTIDGFKKAVNEFNGNGVYIINITDYGNRILTNASGTSGSIIDAFFQVIDTMYNFESQTINPKRSFLSKLQSVFLLNSAIALQYCEAKRDVGNATKIRSNILPAMTRIDNAFNQLAEMEARATKGNDKLLVSGQVISKTMKKETATKGDKYLTTISRSSIEYGISEGFVYVSEDTYRTMIQRAESRGLSLAEDLTSAGFENVSPDEGNRYVYMTGNAEEHVNLDFLDLAGASLKWMFKRVTFTYSEFKATTVTQNGKGNPSVTDNILQTKLETMETVWKKSDTKYHVVPHYSVVLGFAAEE